MDSQQSAPPTTSRSRSGAGVGGVAGGREDCWSESATETLIEAWGDRYMKLNRGNLRQKDWKEVADAVNARKDGVKPRRTDVQCKNRIDTLKKKYKLEKSKPSPSKWPFYSRLDNLVGTPAGAGSTAPSKKATGAVASPSVPNLKPSTTTTLTIKSRPKLNPVTSPNPYSGGASSKSNESSLGGGGGGGDDAECGGGRSRKQRMDSMELSEETAYKELARAILRFGEIYERIENSKQQQLMELEKQRMEFTKDLEFQRMNMFTEAQLELEKMNRPTKYAAGSG